MPPPAAPEPAVAGLLSPDDPPVIEVVNPNATRPLLLICDHASRAIPRRLGALGLSEAHLADHIAWDIGAAAVTRRLAELLDAPAVLGGYSRLVIDLNRQPGHPSSIPETSGGVAVPGNRGLTEAEQVARVEAFFLPYHDAITEALAHLWRQGVPPALFSVHSFTPSLAGDERPWDVGVLWKRDPRMAVPLLEKLRAVPGLVVGDNEPYSGSDLAYTIDLHAGTAGLPHVAVEIRQDGLADDAGAARWADLLADVVEEILARDGLHRVETF